ncbi:rhodanese-like domain-containing protein [Chiayiivirga flava]|uniref:PQQ-dependent catabolism-associated CXXCW motif protein n=1 Tax=Chiayiivirga flava TaxID=659595 RepID=A0A7W8G388_9GAMM|nr:rhodanese-like domain-containing protein [Chiayiivirga flava]MBB5209525.1 PQQ-dependent catabolism-associated CXXCW motif protein [Chiayiivirga flava]
MPSHRNPCIPRAVVSSPALRTFAALLALAASTAALAQQDFGAPTTQPPQYPQPSAPQSPPPAATGVPGYGNAPPAAGASASALQMLVQQEQQDFGVPPQQTLQPQMHGPTPTSIPGGQVITTDRLIPMLAQGPQHGPLVFHVLGPGDMLPGAQMATPASQAGTFDDQTQREFGQYLQQVTQGNKAKPLVFYCLNTQCWMSYNAALRAINMGFSQVMWYRGGIEAWQQAQQMAAGMQSPNGVR